MKKLASIIMALLLVPAVFASIRGVPKYAPSDMVWKSTSAAFDDTWGFTKRGNGDRLFEKQGISKSEWGNNFHCVDTPSCPVRTSTKFGESSRHLGITRRSFMKPIYEFGIFYNRCLFNVDDYAGCEHVEYNDYVAAQTFYGE